MEDERVATLKDWMSRDRDIKMIVNATLRSTEVDTVDKLATDMPVMFADLYAAMAAMIEDIPIHEPPGWSR